MKLHIAILNFIISKLLHYLCISFLLDTYKLQLFSNKNILQFARTKYISAVITIDYEIIRKTLYQKFINDKIFL